MKRWLAGFLTGLMLIAWPGVHAPAEGQSVPPLIEETAQTNGMIRVALTSCGGKGTYNLTISGTYSFNGTTLGNGSKVKVEFINGTVYVTANGTRSAMGSSATLNRRSGGVKVAESLAPSNLYPGDMRFLYSNGKAYVICYLFVEEYVYGVLPYEMDNSFPLEALKAQAITARTYAMRAKTTAGVYDVTDTTNHQVFRGVNYDKARCIQAVNETWGIVLKQNGAYVSAYYSASNGGQTELDSHVWGGTRQTYYDTVEDPFDVANPQSVKKSYLVYKNPSYGSSVSAYAMIRSALASKHGGASEGYNIEEITEMLLHTPMYAAPSRLYTQLRVGVRYNGGKTTTVDIPVFPTVERSLSLGINNSSNEIYTVDVEEKGYRITARRYGHGVGMSQRGAQQMANSGFTYAQILGYYYVGVQRVRMQLTTNWPEQIVIPPRVEELDQTMGGRKATVSLTDAGDRLNLRKEASADSEILIRIPNGEEVIALAEYGGWMRVQYGNQVGFAAKDYLVFDTPKAAAATEVTVVLESGSLNLRSEANEASSIMDRIPNGEKISLLERGEGWSRVQYQNQTGYVLTKHLEITAQAAQSAAKAVVTLPNQSETLNLRQEPATDAPIVALLTHNTELSVLERQEEWTRVQSMGMTGYVMNTFIRFEAGGSSAPVASPVSETPVLERQLATVALKEGNLNLRSEANDTSAILTRIANGSQVEVLLASDDWCIVRFGEQTGFVKRDYLVLLNDTSVAAVTPPLDAPVASKPNDTGVAYIKTTDGDRVNLRRSPAASATVLVRVPDASVVTLLDYQPEWSKVRYGDYTGYVSTQFLSMERPAKAQGVGAGTPLKAGASIWVYTTDGEGVNLRKEPDIKSTSLALMPYGAEMTVLVPGDPWHKVIYKGLTGYVMRDFVSDTKVTANAAQASTDAAQLDTAAEEAVPVQERSAMTAREVVVGDASTTVLNTGKVRLNSPTATLHLKFAPDDLAAEVGTLKQGVSVEILQYYGGDVHWLYVRNGSSKGYVLSEHVVLTNPLAAVTLSDEGSRLTVRAKADASSDPVHMLGNGAIVTVLSSKSGWAQIRTGDGGSGYVAEDYLRML